MKELVTFSIVFRIVLQRFVTRVRFEDAYEITRQLCWNHRCSRGSRSLECPDGPFRNSGGEPLAVSSSPFSSFSFFIRLSISFFLSSRFFSSRKNLLSKNRRYIFSRNFRVSLRRSIVLRSHFRESER